MRAIQIRDIPICVCVCVSARMSYTRARAPLCERERERNIPRSYILLDYCINNIARGARVCLCDV